jgi:prepilin-type processing-associated H-X9-DG protein
MPTCPACAEPISAGVAVCPHCGVRVDDYAAGEDAPRGAKKSSAATVVWIVVGGVLLAGLLCIGVLAALLVPAMQAARGAAQRTQCMNNLKQIGLALHMYHDRYNTFPPAYVADANGKPMHSWRVLILPFLEQQGLYAEYDFTEPWDGPNNSRLLARMPAVYACPSHSGAESGTITAYAGVFGEQCAFSGSQRVAITSITDGTANTLLVGEATGAAIPWMKPEDIDVMKHPALGDRDGFSGVHPGGVNFLLCDGSVRFLELTINPEKLKALFTRNGNEVIGSF